MTESTAPTRTWSTRRTVLTLVGVLGVPTVVVVGAIAIADAVAVDGRDVVVEYMEAIAAGDVETANAIDGGDDPALGSLDDAERIEQVTVADESSAPPQPDEAAPPPREETYDVSYVVGGETVRTSLTVVEVGPSGSTRWSLTDSLVRSVTLTQTTEPELGVLVDVDASIGGETVSVRPTASASVPLYPGVYPVVPTAGAYSVVAPTEVVVTDADASVDIPVTPSDDLAAFVEDEMIDALATCTAEERSLVLRCGQLVLVLDRDVAEAFGAQTAGDAEQVDAITWTVESPAAEQADPDAWTVDVTAVVRATFAIDGETATVDHPVAATWAYQEALDTEPAVVGGWYDPSLG